jgi:DNA-binding GntR family transcriptional regulator
MRSQSAVTPREAQRTYEDCSTFGSLLEPNESVRALSHAAQGRAAATIDSLAERTYARLRYTLIVGQIAPGDRLTIRSLAQQLGTSMTPVRDALSRLAAADALHQIRQSGVIVPVLGPVELDELRRLRLAVEGLAFANAEPHFRTADWRGFKVLHADLCRAAKDADPGRFAAAAWALRTAILGLPRSSVLAMLVDRIWCRLGPTFTKMAADDGRRGQISLLLSRIVAAIGVRDLAEARNAVIDEIEAGTRPGGDAAADEWTAPSLVPNSIVACAKAPDHYESGADDA